MFVRFGSNTNIIGSHFYKLFALQSIAIYVNRAMARRSFRDPPGVFISVDGAALGSHAVKCKFVMFSVSNDSVTVTPTT